MTDTYSDSGTVSVPEVGRKEAALPSSWAAHPFSTSPLKDPEIHVIIASQSRKWTPRTASISPTVTGTRWRLDRKERAGVRAELLLSVVTGTEQR